MIEVKNKVVFIRPSAAGMAKAYQLSANVQGKLKKKIIKVKKLKIKEKIAVELSGSFKDIQIKIEPANTEHAAKIKAMLTVKS